MKNKLMLILNWLKINKIKTIIITFLIVAFVIISAKENKNLFTTIETKQELQSVEQIETNIQKESLNQNSLAATSIKTKTAVIFFHPTCHSCSNARHYIDKVLKHKYPKVKFEFHDITSPEEMTLMETYYRSYKLNKQLMTTPTIFVGNEYILGYDSDEKTGKDLEKIIQRNFLSLKRLIFPKNLSNKNKLEKKNHVDTFFGKINLFRHSLVFLAITLGLVDGLNPCAIWVLVYLITLIARLNDKRKIWLIVGSFLLASGILYYLLMTTLLRVFLFIGYLRILQLLIGCIAFYIGVVDISVYIKNKGQITCKIDDAKSKQKTMTKVQKLVNAKISLMTILGVIGLAFAVNSIEFVCSSALPAIFTSILAQANLSMVQYHLYILLYVIFFMLDDLIIFSVAAFAINRYFGDHYLSPSKLIGGIILFVLGVIMIFFPQYIR